MLVTNELITFVREQFEDALLGAQHSHEIGIFEHHNECRKRAAEWATILGVLEQQLPSEPVEDAPPRLCM